jgi:hypothetical protein
VEGGDVVTMDGRYGVVGLAEPEEDDADRWRCWWDVWGVMDVAVSSEDVLLEFGHVGVGDRCWWSHPWRSHPSGHSIPLTTGSGLDGGLLLGGK